MSEHPQMDIRRSGDHYCGSFFCMASPCELLIDTDDALLANHLTQLAQREAVRIELKFSRYRNDNIIAQINTAKGATTTIDQETYRLLAYADTCYQLSDGMFDITSGVLREVWKFDGSDRIASNSDVAKLLPLIGWQKASLTQNSLYLPANMQIDLGGIGKEYAVDAVAALLQKTAPDISALINFGGDIQVTKKRSDGKPWIVGIENPTQHQSAKTAVKIYQGGLATSGDANRYLVKDGKRYSHILNPKTGFPVMHAPRSVTVAANFCTQAGLLATLALLQGKHAELFLHQQEVTHWIYR